MQTIYSNTFTSNGFQETLLLNISFVRESNYNAKAYRYILPKIVAASIVFV